MALLAVHLVSDDVLVVEELNILDPFLAADVAGGTTLLGDPCVARDHLDVALTAGDP
jgi:hypothetical protein